MATSIYQKIQDLLPKTSKERIFETTRVRDLAPKWANIATANTSDSLHHVFRMLIDHSILFAPLYDDDVKEYIGFIDMLDILTYVVDVLKLRIDENNDWIHDPAFQNTSCLKANPIGSTVADRKVRNKWHMINENAPLYSAINVLSQPDVHKIGVIDSFGKLISFITKSNIIEFLSQQNMELGALGDKDLDYLSLISKDIITVEKDEKAINAFHKIYTHGISGVGVIDEKCNIIGNISFPDLELMGFSNDIFKSLCMPTEEFLRIKEKHRTKVIKTLKSSSLREMLSNLREGTVQRIYVLTKDDLLYGVIPLTSIIFLFNALHAPMPQR